MSKVEFTVGAKAARLIGRENIADVDGALIELIKNAYDADASCVLIKFEMPFPNVPVSVDKNTIVSVLSKEDYGLISKWYVEKDSAMVRKDGLSINELQSIQDVLFAYNRIIVADNGSGMDLNTVRTTWMQIGTSDKEKNTTSKKGRIKTGAKGIGRFALDKLSMQSIMYTKSDDSKAVVRWGMNWEQFSEATLINEVQADISHEGIDYQTVVRQWFQENSEGLEKHSWETGTLFILSPIRDEWSVRLFKKVNTNLASINPIGGADIFVVDVKNLYYPEYNYTTKDVAIDEDDYDYAIYVEYDGEESLNVELTRNEVDLDVNTVVVGDKDNSKEISVDDFWKRESFTKQEYRRETYNGVRKLKPISVTDVLPNDDLDKIRSVGPFSAQLFFLRNSNSDGFEIMKRINRSRRKKMLDSFSGIKIYRDNFKVRPYGDEGALADWLGLAKLAQNPSGPGHLNNRWRVEPYQMIGWVKIGRKTNPNLGDMANREGIVLSESYYIFVDLINAAIDEFEIDRQYIYREYAKWRKEKEDEITPVVSQILMAAENNNLVVENKESRSGTGIIMKTKGMPVELTNNDMVETVQKLVGDSKNSLNEKQILEVLGSSGIVLNTFFHEFKAINTQFHVEAPQIRSRVKYILNGNEYDGIPAYNPYNRLDALEKNDRVTAAFLDVVMDGLKKSSLSVNAISISKAIREITAKWMVLLEERSIDLIVNGADDTIPCDLVRIALVDLYIIINNYILNASWFLEREINESRIITIKVIVELDVIRITMHNNGPSLSEKYANNPNRIFELGETTKDDGKGTGLGLWLVKETVDRNEGHVFVMDCEQGFGIIVELKKDRNND